MTELECVAECAAVDWCRSVDYMEKGCYLQKERYDSPAVGDSWAPYDEFIVHYSKADACEEEGGDESSEPAKSEVTVAVNYIKEAGACTAGDLKATDQFKGLEVATAGSCELFCGLIDSCAAMSWDSQTGEC